MWKYGCHAKGNHGWRCTCLAQMSQWLSGQTDAGNRRSWGLESFCTLDQQSAKQMQIWNIPREVAFKIKASWGARNQEIHASNWSHNSRQTRGSPSHQGRHQWHGMTGPWQTMVDLPGTYPFKCCLFLTLAKDERRARERKGESWLSNTGMRPRQGNYFSPVKAETLI